MALGVRARRPGDPQLDLPRRAFDQGRQRHVRLHAAVRSHARDRDALRRPAQGQGPRRRGDRAPGAGLLRRIQVARGEAQGGRARQRSGDGRASRALRNAPSPRAAEAPKDREVRSLPTMPGWPAPKAERGGPEKNLGAEGAAPTQGRRSSASSTPTGFARGAEPPPRRHFVDPRGRREDRPDHQPGGRARDHAGDAAAGGRQASTAAQDEHLAHSLATLDRNTRDLQEAVMSIRMMPMEFVFSRFPRLVRDLAAQARQEGRPRHAGPGDRARQGA